MQSSLVLSSDASGGGREAVEPAAQLSDQLAVQLGLQQAVQVPGELSSSGKNARGESAELLGLLFVRMQLDLAVRPCARPHRADRNENEQFQHLPGE